MQQRIHIMAQRFPVLRQTGALDGRRDAPLTWLLMHLTCGEQHGTASGRRAHVRHGENPNDCTGDFARAVAGDGWGKGCAHVVVCDVCCIEVQNPASNAKRHPWCKPV